MFDVFLNAPLLFLVPLALLVFIIWAPWSPRHFYIQHDWEHLKAERPELPLVEERETDSVSD